MSDELTETVFGEVSCACSIGEDPREHLLMLLFSKDPEDHLLDVKYDAIDWFKELFAEHLGERFEIIFYEWEDDDD